MSRENFIMSIKNKLFVKKIFKKFIPMCIAILGLYLLDIYYFRRDEFRISYVIIIVITCFAVVTISSIVNTKKDNNGVS